MGIVSTNRRFQEREGSVEYTSTGGAIVTYTQTYQVLTDDATHDEAYVLANAAIPQPYTEHPNDPTALAIEYSAEQQEGSRLLWLVTVEFTNDISRIGEDGEPIGPRVKRSISTNLIPRIIRKDLETGETIANSAGVPYAPSGLQFPRANILVTYTRNENSFSEAAIVVFANHLNSQPFKGYPPKSLLCRGVNADEQFINQDGIVIGYWQVSYTFEWSWDGWDHVPLDEGFEHIPEAGAKIAPIFISGGKVTEPWPLDGNGMALTEAEVQAGTFFYNRFTVYPLADFNLLGL